MKSDPERRGGEMLSSMGCRKPASQEDVCLQSSGETWGGWGGGRRGIEERKMGGIGGGGVQRLS